MLSRIFSIDSGFYKFMTKFADYAIITILTVVCCIPVITIGPAFVALFYVALKLAKDEEGYIVRGYFKAFKSNFKQGVAFELILLAVGIIMYMSSEAAYYWGMHGGGWFPKILFCAQIGIGALIIATTIYVIPVIARFQNGIFSLIRSSFLMAVKHLPQTVMMLVVDILLIMYTINYPALWVADVGIIAFANSFVLARLFTLYMPKEENPEDELSEFSELSDNETFENAITDNVNSNEDITDNVNSEEETN